LALSETDIESGADRVPAIELKGVSFSYPDGRRTLKDLSLVVFSGERVAVLGPNGAGKTTLALHLNGILPLQHGEIAVGGLSINPTNIKEVRRRVGLVFHDPDDQLFMSTVEEDVGFGPANLGLSAQEQDRRVSVALDRVHASSLRTRTPHHLSAGEKRRVSIATVLSMDPEVLVLDEPTSGLDPFGKRELIKLLQQLEPAQLIITHDLPFALELCPRSVIVSEGQIVADGSTAEILSDDALLKRHRLELPYGFDRSFLNAHGSGSFRCP